MGWIRRTEERFIPCPPFTPQTQTHLHDSIAHADRILEPWLHFSHPLEQRLKFSDPIRSHTHTHELCHKHKGMGKRERGGDDERRMVYIGQCCIFAQGSQGYMFIRALSLITYF
jgi:hypothetical protein